MALKIRLARGGSKKRPIYSIVVADVRAPRDGRFVEKVGSYNPLLAKDAEQRVVLNTERVQHWISKGAKPTDRVLRFLDGAGLATRPARNNPKKALLGKKAQERLDEKQAKEEEAKAAATAKAAEAEAPTGEPEVAAPVDAPQAEPAADASETESEKA